MIIEAVTVCVNYAHTLKYAISNKHLVDRWVIVTKRDDLDTIKLCKNNDVEVIFTDRLHEDGAEFAKGKAINDGFDSLTKSDWLIHLDADTILPKNFRDMTSQIKSDPESKKNLYGSVARRGIGLGLFHEKWDCCTKDLTNLREIYKLFHSITQSNDSLSMEEQMSLLVNSGLFESKLDSIEQQWEAFVSGNWGRLPYIFEGSESSILGNFQMFHSSAFTKYPEESPNTWWDDVTFRDTFPEKNRVILDFECAHVGYNSGHSDSTLRLDEYSGLNLSRSLG